MGGRTEEDLQELHPEVQGRLAASQTLRRAATMAEAQREKALSDYRSKLMEHREMDAKLKKMRADCKALTKQYDKSENDLKALQSVGRTVGEVLRQLTEEKFIVKATNGPRYVVGCRRQLDKAKLRPGTRVALDMTTLTIMRYLPREVDPLVYNMSHEDPGDVTYSAIGGLGEQIRELREVIELPLLNPGKETLRCHTIQYFRMPRNSPAATQPFPDRAI